MGSFLQRRNYGGPFVGMRFPRCNSSVCDSPGYKKGWGYSLSTGRCSHPGPWSGRRDHLGPRGARMEASTPGAPASCNIRWKRRKCTFRPGLPQRGICDPGELAPRSISAAANHSVTPASRQKSSDFDLASLASVFALVLAMWLRMKL
jgi:hypothetical protein